MLKIVQRFHNVYVNRVETCMHMELYGNFLQTKFKYFPRLPHICEQTPVSRKPSLLPEDLKNRIPCLRASEISLPHNTDNKSGLSKSFLVAG